SPFSHLSVHPHYYATITLLLDHPTPPDVYSLSLHDALPISKLVLNFSSPVNPTIGTEPGKLNMIFLRDPLVPSGPETVNFNDKTDRKSTRLNSSHGSISYAVFCLKKKNNNKIHSYAS